jgi:alkaline phosphatase D
VQRRDFLKLTVLSAAGMALGLSGCNDGDGESTQPADNNGLLLRDGARYFPHGVASGDPKAHSLILWTRLEGGGRVRLQVARDSGFTDLVLDHAGLEALAAHDGCVKVKITDLQPASFYHYRFLYQPDDKNTYVSSSGRSKTAPAADADVAVRFAVLSCQDYVGRYYNSLSWLLEQGEEPDFVVYLGDYIYETTGDPRFQGGDAQRKISFSAPGEAIALGTREQPYHAAQSLSNYRDLYKTYRTDPVLQALHARFPIVAIWDDHEYADDCWGASAVYHNGKRRETDAERRRNAEQVFFEYLPVDDESVQDYEHFFPARENLYPNTRLYRDLRFGQHLHLLLTDYRSFRPDHLIPEEAFPGKVVLDKHALTAIFEAQAPGMGALLYERQKAAFGAYVDMADPAWGKYLPALVLLLTTAYGETDAAPEVLAGKAYGDVSGKLSSLVFNQLAMQYNLALQAGQLSGEPMPVIDPATEATLDRGLAYLHFGKQGFFSEIGSRYGVVKASFDLYAGYRYLADLQQGKTPENVLGNAQQTWLETTLFTSDATFVALGSPVSTTSLILDLSQQTALPAEFRTAFYLNVDHWDGFPNRRQYLLGALRKRGNAFVFAGDIHASLVTDHDGVADFTGPAVSSETFQAFTGKAIEGLAASFSAEQRQFLQAMLLPNLDALLRQGFAKLKFASSNQHGFILMEVNGQQVSADYHLLPAEHATRRHYGDPAALANLVQRKRFVLHKNGPLEDL